MKFGLSIPTLTGFQRATEPADGGWRTRWERTYEICQLAESLGFEFGALGHHRFTPTDIDLPQPMVAIAAMAARTTRLKFCTNILILPLHHPLDVAEQAAMVDELSNGRVILGVGIGNRPYEAEQINLNYRERVSRLEEAIEIVRRSWRGEAVNFVGRHFTVAGAIVSPRPVQQPGPPIWLGAQVNAAISRAARIGDGWLTDNIESAASLGQKVVRFRQESHACGHAGTVILNRKVGIGRDRETIENEWLPPILNVYRKYLRQGLPFDKAFTDKLTSGQHVRIVDLPQDQIIMGTPEQCVIAIQKCIAETACDYIIVDFGRGAHGEAFVKLRDQINLFGREVMPHFR